MSRGKTPSFLSGGELRGLIVFAVVMAVGWPVILNYARPRDRTPEPPRVIDSRPLEPDKGIAFDRLLDKTLPAGRDNPAYKILLDRARNTSAAELAKQARRDVMYTQLWERPDLYRGVPIHFEGTLRKVIVHQKMNPEMVPGGQLIDAWFYTRESNQLPFVVSVQEPPPGMVAGSDYSERVVVDGYFLRLIGYLAGDATRASPLLVGRIRWANADPKTGAPVDAAGAPSTTWPNTVIVVMVMLGLYVTARVVFSIRKRRAPLIVRTGLLADDRPVEDIAAEDLSSFLASVPDEDDEERPDHDELHRLT